MAMDMLMSQEPKMLGSATKMPGRWPLAMAASHRQYSRQNDEHQTRLRKMEATLENIHSV